MELSFWKKKTFRSSLEDLVVEKVPGIGPHLKEYLNNMSVSTLGQLRQIPREELIRRFGKAGLRMSEVCRGEDREEVGYWQDEGSPPKSVSHSYTLEKEINRRPELEAWIRCFPKWWPAVCAGKTGIADLRNLSAR